MNTTNSKLLLLKEEKVSKALLKLGIPSMIGMMTSALYSLVDAFFVGQLGTSQVGAVSIVFPLSILILGIGLLFGAGASSYLARLLGAQRYEEASECASTVLISSVGVGLLLITSILFFLNPILLLLGSTETILPFAREYAVIFLIGLGLNVFNITFNNMITAEGATMYSMIAMLSGGILNILLDPLFIITFKMGVRGAAIATLCARVLSCLIFLSYIMSGKSVFQFSLKNFNPRKVLYFETFKVGTPMLMFQLLNVVTLGITNSLSARFGDSAIAATGIVIRIMQMGGMCIMGFLKGYQPFVGYNYGSGDMDRVKDATRFVLKGTTLFCVIYGTALILFREPIMSGFSRNDDLLVSIGCRAILLNALMFTGFGYMMVFVTRFMAMGRAKEGGILGLARQGMIFIPLVFLLTRLFGINGLIAAQPTADLLTMSLIFLFTMIQKRSPEGATQPRLEKASP